MNSLLFSLRQKRSVKYFTFDDSTRGWDIGIWQLEDQSTEPSISKFVPGTQGFGVSICPEDTHQMNIMPLPGYDDPANDNYGNYIHTPSGSIMCWIPAFKYRVNDKFVNSVEVWLADDPKCPSNAVLHRAFINGGKEKSGFFCDKYICSPDANNTMGISVKNGSVLSLSTSAYFTNRTSQLANCSGRFDDAITASRARGAGFQCMSVFQLGALRLLTLAHAQASKSNEFNAWYDSTGQHNLPKGATNGSGKDYDRPNGTWQSGLTGSCSVFAESTHNGQNSGVADLKGILYQVVTGYIGSGSYYFLKPEVDITTLDKDAMYNSSNHNSHSMPFTGWQGWDQSRPMFNNDSTGIHWDCCGFLNTVTNAGNNYFAGMFEEDREHITATTNSFPYFGCNWDLGDSQVVGLFYSLLDFYRSDDFTYVGFRACGYL